MLRIENEAEIHEMLLSAYADHEVTVPQYYGREKRSIVGKKVYNKYLKQLGFHGHDEGAYRCVFKHRDGYIVKAPHSLDASFTYQMQDELHVSAKIRKYRRLAKYFPELRPLNRDNRFYVTKLLVYPGNRHDPFIMSYNFELGWWEDNFYVKLDKAIKLGERLGINDIHEYNVMLDPDTLHPQFVDYQNFMDYPVSSRLRF